MSNILNAGLLQTSFPFLFFSLLPDYARRYVYYVYVRHWNGAAFAEVVSHSVSRVVCRFSLWAAQMLKSHVSLQVSATVLVRLLFTLCFSFSALRLSRPAM